MFVTVYFIDELRTPALLIGIIFGIVTLSGTVASHFAGKIGVSKYDESSDLRIRLLTTGLQLGLYGYIIIIRLLPSMVGNEISS